MRKLMLLCASLCAVAFVDPASSAQAQTLAWVSPTGSDSNACSETAPCATFAHVISSVVGVAQINCLGSGNYGGPVVITGSIIIDCGMGNIGEITTGINIDTSSAATVVLRHLSLDGSNTNMYGIYAAHFAGGTLIVEDCMIQGFSAGAGLYLAPSAARSTLQVSHSLLSDNEYAIYINTSAGQIASIALNRDELIGNMSTALIMTGTGTVAGTMRHSLVAENSGDGVVANSTQAYFTVEETSVIDNLDSGIATGSSGAIVNVGAATIGGNGTGVQPAAGSIISFGNNQISANGSNGSFTSTMALQ